MKVVVSLMLILGDSLKRKLHSLDVDKTIGNTGGATLF